MTDKRGHPLTDTATSFPVLGHINELDSGWLTAALGQQVDEYQSQEIVGEGYASRMYRLIVNRVGETQPLRLILKLATVNEVQRDVLDENQLFREVYFYRDYAARLADTGILPVIYVAETDLERLQITILMEDIGDIPHKPFRENLDNSLAAVELLAKVHAAYWQADVLQEENLTPVDTQISVAEINNLVHESLAVEAAATYSFPYLRNCMHHLLKLTKWMIGEADRFTGAITLVHGDFHARNIHFIGERAVLFDWQITERGRPARDLVYWLLSSVDVDDAEAFEPQLIERYLQVLADNGVDYPRKAFDADYKEVCGQLIPRFFCYQALIQLGEDEGYVAEDFLRRIDRLAQKMGLLNQLRVARVIAPPMMFTLQLLGLRKRPRME